MGDETYHQRPEWSFSLLKNILVNGIDWAVSYKNGDLPKPDSKFIDIGTFVHQELLGGDKDWVAKVYPDYRTKEARAWRDSQTKTILDEEQVETIINTANAIKAHPLLQEVLANMETEKAIFAKVNGVELRGKADIVQKDKTGKPICIWDIKTTAQFQEWKYKCLRLHYDLQAATYRTLYNGDVDFAFIIAETVEPYRVQIAYMTPEAWDKGESDLARCLQAIKEFGDKKPSFSILEPIYIGDWS
jgi:hypothetical protein